MSLGLKFMIMLTIFQLKVNEITRMKAPFDSKCMDNWEQSGYNISSNYSYSVSLIIDIERNVI